MRLVASKAACRRWTQQCDWFGVCAHCAHAHLDAGRHCDVWVLEGLEACELQRDMMNNEAYSNGWRLKLEDKTRRRAAAAPAEAKAIADATDKELGRGLILGPFTTFKYLVRAVSDAVGRHVVPWVLPRFARWQTDKYRAPARGTAAWGVGYADDLQSAPELSRQPL